MTLTATPLKAYPLTATRLTALRLGETVDVPNYLAAGKSPELVADYYRDYYRADSANTDFDTLFDFSRAGLATMTDSDGVLKWGAHNLLTYSEDFTNAAWSAFGSASVTANQGIAPDGLQSADLLSCTSSGDAKIRQSLAVSGEYTLKVWAKPSAGNGILYLAIDAAADRRAWFDLNSGSVLSDPESSNAAMTAEAGGYWCEISGNITSSVSFIIELANAAGASVADADDSFFIWGAHLYRSDLGGMANNPATGNSYVPTTDSAVYLPRRNHHVWDGSKWVNKGLLIESESRTNLLLNSETPATQSVTVTDATEYTLSVQGSGSAEITAGGSGTATDGSPLTFTSSGTSVTVTVTGSLDRFQLEAGATPSSWIPTSGSTATRASETLSIPAAKLPYNSTAVSIAMEGEVTYADENLNPQVRLSRWQEDSNNNIELNLSTNAILAGTIVFRQEFSGTGASVTEELYTPGLNVPFSIASRHGSTFINGAVDGTALTENTTPTALPDLSTTDLDLAPNFMGTIKSFRMWGQDVTAAGIEEASE